MGVTAIKLDNDDELVGCDIAEDNKYFLVISEEGFGKITALEEYRTQGRAGSGIITYKPNKKTGNLVAAKVVDKDDDIMIITSGGIIIRIRVDQISKMGRATSGVKLMNIKDSKVVAIAKYIGD